MILSARTQAGIIGKVLDDQDVLDDVGDHLVGEWREYWDWLHGQGQNATFTDLLNTFGGWSEQHLINIKLVARVRHDPIEYKSIDETLASLPDLHWLWQGWIARGQITILVGDPSAGKSYFSLDLAQRIAAGSVYPDDVEVGQPGVVLYLDAENRPMVLKTRIAPWSQAERWRFYYMLPQSNRMMINLDHDDDRERFLDRVYVIRPDLVIIDSYSTITLRGENNKEDVQRLLSFLTRVARDYDCAIVVIHHNRKPGKLQMTLPGIPPPRMEIHSVRGSGHIAAMATNVLGMQLAGLDRNGPRILQVVKNNLGLYPGPIGVTFTPWEVDPEVAILSYGDVPKADVQETKIQGCMDWLVEVLDENGSLPTSEVVDLALEAGYGRRMLYRARKRLGERVRDSKTPHVQGNEWGLNNEV